MEREYIPFRILKTARCFVKYTLSMPNSTLLLMKALCSNGDFSGVYGCRSALGRLLHHGFDLGPAMATQRCKDECQDLGASMVPPVLGRDIETRLHQHLVHLHGHGPFLCAHPSSLDLTCCGAWSKHSPPDELDDKRARASGQTNSSLFSLSCCFATIASGALVAPGVPPPSLLCVLCFLVPFSPRRRRAVRFVLCLRQAGTPKSATDRSCLLLGACSLCMMALAGRRTSGRPPIP